MTGLSPQISEAMGDSAGLHIARLEATKSRTGKSLALLYMRTADRLMV